MYLTHTEWNAMARHTISASPQSSLLTCGAQSQVPTNRHQRLVTLASSPPPAVSPDLRCTVGGGRVGMVGRTRHRVDSPPSGHRTPPLPPLSTAAAAWRCRRGTCTPVAGGVHVEGEYTNPCFGKEPSHLFECDVTEELHEVVDLVLPVVEVGRCMAIIDGFPYHRC